MDIIPTSIKFAKKEYAKHDKHHQWSHVKNVMITALKLAKHYPKTNLELLKLAIIFHDITYKNYETHVDDSAQTAEQFLQAQHYPTSKINKIKKIIFAHSSPHRRKFGNTKLIEGKIIYDADKFQLALDSKLYQKYYPQLYLKETKQMINKLNHSNT